MAQFYTLDEAAQRLGMPADEFKRRLKTETAFTAIRPFRDGPTLRFRAADIDELARTLGAASDPGFPLGPVGADPAESADDVIYSTPPGPVPGLKPKSARLNPPEPLVIVADDSEDGDDIFSAAATKKADADSNARLDSGPAGARAYDPNAALPTEEIDLDLAGAGSAVIKGSGLSGKLGSKSGPKPSMSDSGKIPGPTAAKPPVKDDSSSEFELSVDPEQDSFEFQLSGDSSDEVDLGGGMGGENKGGQSGINLGKPSDSGVSLEKRKKPPKTGPFGKAGPADDDSDIDFELSLDPPGPSGSRSGLGKKAAKPAGPADSDSEFELTLDSNSGVVDGVASSLAPNADGSVGDGDMFETDFELPVVDEESGADLVAVDPDASEEFEVALDEEVELVEDEGDAVMVVDEEVDAADEEAADALPSRRRSAASRDLADLDDDDYDRPAVPAPAAVAAPARWGALPAVVLLLTLPFVFIGALSSFEVMKGMLGYHQSNAPSNSLVRGIAGALGKKPAD